MRGAWALEWVLRPSLILVFVYFSFVATDEPEAAWV